MFNRKQRRALRNQLKRDNRNWPEELKLVDSEDAAEGLIEVWRSSRFLLQIYAVNEAVERLSMCRTTGDTDQQPMLSLYEMQRLKMECGRGAAEAVVILPANGEPIDIDVGSMRHLWVFKNGLKLPFGFGQQGQKEDKDGVGIETS